MTPTIAENLAGVREKIGEAARRAGRDPADVTLVAVSKTKPVEAVAEALAAGQTNFGENYVQEALAKIGAAAGAPVWHMIGHCQRNKAKAVAGHFHWVQAIDSLRLARALERHATEAGRVLEGLVQVNRTGEAGKAGIADEREWNEVVEFLAGCRSLMPRGLMTIPDPAYDERALRAHFAQMRELRDDLAGRWELPKFDQLSMGMSHDFQWAIEEGATIVRVGTAIFGART